MLTAVEYIESISGGGATGNGKCILNMSIGSADEDGTEFDLGVVKFACVVMEENYMVDLTFTDPLMRQRLYTQLESYGRRFNLRDGRASDKDHMFFQFAPDEEYWDQYMLAMNPRFWALTVDDYYGEANTIRLLFNEQDILFATADDIGEDDPEDTWDDTSEIF